MKLSIIIPAYNADDYLPPLLDCLNKQMQDGVEVLIIDDESKNPVKCSYKWAKVIRQKNAGPGLARNRGLDNCTGDYIAFIDADDMVSPNYIDTILKKIDAEHFDYCYLSWRSMPGQGWQVSVKLNSVEDEFPGYNLCVWNRVYKRDLIGDMRFSKNKLWSEDADFIYRLKERGKKAFISDFMYYYRSDTPNSWTKRMFSGDLDYTRIVYNVKETSEELLKEVKKEYETKEIVLLTNDHHIEDFKNYCMWLPYCQPIKGDELRGDKYDGFTKIKKPIRTQIVIWTARTALIGGIETFIYNFCRQMCKYYDIIVLYDDMAPERIAALLPYVLVMKRGDNKIKCDTLIINRITDTDPPGVTYNKKIQMAHICHMDRYTVPSDNDVTVYASEHCKKSYKAKEGIVIHNMTTEKSPVLLIVSAMRTTYEKGTARIVKLSKAMEAAGIKHKWLCFTDNIIPGATDSMIFMKPTLDIGVFIQKADYVAQLSDDEAFCYVLLEALEAHTAVLCTPLGVLPELGIKDGENGYIIPFDGDPDVERFKNVPEFDYEWKNEPLVKKWRKILGNTKPTRSYNPTEQVLVCAKMNYYDIVLQRNVTQGEIITCTALRAADLNNKGLGEKI